MPFDSEFYVCARYSAGAALLPNYIVGNCGNCNHPIQFNEKTRGGAPASAEPLCDVCFANIDSPGDEWAITEEAIAEARRRNPRFERLDAIAHLRRRRDEIGKRIA